MCMLLNTSLRWRGLFKTQHHNHVDESQISLKPKIQVEKFRGYVSSQALNPRPTLIFH